MTAENDLYRAMVAHDAVGVSRFGTAWTWFKAGAFKPVTADDAAVPEQLLSADEVGERLGGVPARQVLAMAREGSFDFVVHVGRRVRFSERGLNRWLARRKGKGR